MRSVCWFRNDLRVLDNPAFYYCCQNSEEVIATFFVNRKQWLEHNDAEVKVNFWIRNFVTQLTIYIACAIARSTFFAK